MGVRHCYRVSDELALLAIPKVAATSMIKALGLENPCLAHEAQREGLFVAAFVRNPYDRLVSAWEDKRRKVPPGLAAAGFSKRMPFSDFVEFTSESHDLDHHIRQQHRFIVHRGRLSADFIGRFERIDEDWDRLRKMFDLPALPHVNSSQRRESFEDYYTPAIKRLAYKTYRRDLRLFGYK